MREFKEFKGKHMFSGIDIGSAEIERYDIKETVDTVSFILDGKAYKVTEDPSDGYRSGVLSFEETSDTVFNQFDPIEVFCLYREKGTYSGTDDVLEIRNIDTGELILEVGTSNIDDYYPSYVCNFTPENLGKTK